MILSFTLIAWTFWMDSRYTLKKKNSVTLHDHSGPWVVTIWNAVLQKIWGMDMGFMEEGTQWWHSDVCQGSKTAEGWHECHEVTHLGLCKSHKWELLFEGSNFWCQTFLRITNTASQEICIYLCSLRQKYRMFLFTPNVYIHFTQTLGSHLWTLVLVHLLYQVKETY